MILSFYPAKAGIFKQMLTIRLTRVGKKKDASFRVIVIDSKRKVKAGNYLEMLGSYDPRKVTEAFKIDRIKHWLSVGAQTSATVWNLLVKEGVVEGKKIKAWQPKKKATAPAAREEPKVETPA